MIARERKEAADAFLHRQEKGREDRIAGLKAAERTDLDGLSERHQQQQREQSFRYDENRARHLRELDAAANRLAEIEERHRQEEREAEQRRTRDGPRRQNAHAKRLSLPATKAEPLLHQKGCRAS